MSQPGIGAMLSMLSGQGQGGEVVEASKGKTIDNLSVDDDVCRIAFDDGTAILIKDEGQSCCEDRYITCDDDNAALIGGTLEDISLRDGPEEEGEYGDVHETQFVIVQTSKGAFTLCSHNEHNGYYGGFWMQVSEEGAPND